MSNNGIYEPVWMHILIDIAKNFTSLNSHQQFMRVLISTHSSMLHIIRWLHLCQHHLVLHFLNYERSTFSFIYWWFCWLTFLLSSSYLSYRHVGAQGRQEINPLSALARLLFIIFLSPYVSSKFYSIKWSMSFFMALGRLG